MITYGVNLNSITLANYEITGRQKIKTSEL
jgi:hypothetical protein